MSVSTSAKNMIQILQPVKNIAYKVSLTDYEKLNT